MALPVSNGGLLQNMASELLEIEQRLKGVVGNDERVPVYRIDSREGFLEIVERISKLFAQILLERRTDEFEVAESLWNSFVEEWDQNNLLLENLEIISQLIPLPERRVFREEEEKKVNTQGIFGEFQTAIRNRDLSAVPHLLARSEAKSLSPEEVKSLLLGVFDAPECFPNLTTYARYLDPKMLLELLEYGIKHKKWDGVLFLMGAPAFYLLEMEALLELNKQLPLDAPESVRGNIATAIEIQLPS